MKRRHAVHQPIAICAASLVSSCAWVPSYVSDPGVAIERITTSTGRVNSANFWANTQGFQLRGDITPQPVTKGPLGGHVDVVVTSPDGTTTECWTTRQQTRPRHVRKPYAIRFEQLPVAGSVVRVKHHDGPNHDDCVS